MSRPSRILFMNPVGEMGGAERVLLNVMSAVVSERPETEIYLITGTDGDLLPEARKLGAVARLVPMPDQVSQLGDSHLKMQSLSAVVPRLAVDLLSTIPGAWRYVGQIGRAANEIAPHLIHSNGIKSHLFTRFIHAPRRPAIWHLHDFLSTRPVTSKTLRLASTRVARAIAVSQPVADDARTVLDSSVKIDVISNTIDTNRFKPDPGNGAWLDQLAKLPKAEDGTIRVGLIATYAKWKGHEIFLQSAAQLISQSQSAAQKSPVRLRFYIIGSPIYRTTGAQYLRSDIEAMIQTLRLGDHVGLIEYQPDIVPIYQALDLITHCSTEPEPFGMTIAEALSCGRPVIYSETAALSSFLSSGHDSLAIAPKDPTLLAHTIRELATDPDRCKALAEAARRTAVTQFVSIGLGQKLWKCYDQTIPP